MEIDMCGAQMLRPAIIRSNALIRSKIKTERLYNNDEPGEDLYAFGPKMSTFLLWLTE